jgi:2-oxoglutarate dehydrogenase E1 component
VCGSGGGRKGSARQFYCGNRPEDRRNVIPILLHGDPAFAGQGVVYETMQLAGVDDFHIGGTIHAIVNNQIGFTTNPVHSRSTPYCSDLGKAFNCPISHCNGDDPLSISTALETAVEWCHEWGSDVIIDKVCYRRNGHNELDQPAFTHNPNSTKKIIAIHRLSTFFGKRLIQEGTLSKEECQ